MSARGPKGESALARGRSDRGVASDRWATPRAILADARDLAGVGDWGVDLAASPGSAVAPLWAGPEAFQTAWRDGLTVPVDLVRGWCTAGQGIWCNPPYRLVGPFAARCAELAEALAVPVALLAFARTDTRWWHDTIIPYATLIAFRRGRVRFVDPDTGTSGQSAPAPSALIVFGPARPQVIPAGWWTVPGRRCM